MPFRNTPAVLSSGTNASEHASDASGWLSFPIGQLVRLSNEHRAVFKLLFFRGKDIVDLERLVAVRADIDAGYVRKWLVDMMGEHDDRVRRWDAIVATHARP